jgi:hypothetical protein
VLLFIHQFNVIYFFDPKYLTHECGSDQTWAAKSSRPTATPAVVLGFCFGRALSEWALTSEPVPRPVKWYNFICINELNLIILNYYSTSHNE